MKKRISNTGVFTLLVFTAGTLQPAAAQDEISKTYHKEYAVDNQTTLVISNKYGDVNFEDWDKNAIEIDVKISVDLPDRERAQKMLDYLDVEFSQAGSRIEATTTIDNRFSRSGWNRWGKEGKKFSIDYTIHAPASIDAELMNKYGDTFVSKISGHALLSVKYGNLKVNKLTRADAKPLNIIVIGYGKGVIDEAKWLKLDMKYSKLEIGKAQALAGETAYSKLTIDELSSLVAESKYDTYKLGTVKNLILDIAYGHVSANKVTAKVSVESRYTGINIEHIPAGFKSIKIDNKYGSISLGIDEDASYKLKAEAQYCKISVPESSQLSRIVENTSSTYSGIVGKQQNPSSTVSIETRYGSVKLY
ncbi:MAG: DUF4097 domain-containing protein [Chlorobi bacterium]|nr:DUF4097 domain-containing protein [Chlorobiota bacterium]